MSVAVGPAGPIGPIGSQGPIGPQGPAGEFEVDGVTITTIDGIARAIGVKDFNDKTTRTWQGTVTEYNIDLAAGRLGAGWMCLVEGN